MSKLSEESLLSSGQLESMGLLNNILATKELESMIEIINSYSGEKITYLLFSELEVSSNPIYFYPLRSELQSRFFDLYAQGALGRNFIVNFIQENLNPESGLIYTGIIVNVLEAKDYSIELFADILAIPTLTEPTLTACFMSIIKFAAKNSQKYAPLKQALTSIINGPNNDDIQETLEPLPDGDLLKEYAIQELMFRPITSCPTLITEDIEGLSSITNNILKKTRTNFEGQKREEIKVGLILSLEKLIQTNPPIAKIMNMAGKNVQNINISAEGDSGGVYFDYNNNVFIRGTSDVLSLAAVVVHELTHAAIYHIFKNECLPYQKGNIDIETSQTQLAQKIVESIQEYCAAIDLSQFYGKPLSHGYSECMIIRYSKNDWLSELPAYFIEELAIRILYPDPDMRPSILLANYDTIMGAIIEPMLTRCNALEEKDDNDVGIHMLGVVEEHIA